MVIKRKATTAHEEIPCDVLMVITQLDLYMVMSTAEDTVYLNAHDTTNVGH